MRWKEVLPALAVGLALVGLAAVPAAEKPAAKSIDKLVKQLGSDSFAERNEAAKQLDAIGAKALPALEKASKSSDTEVRKRATELFSRIGFRTRTQAVLAPTMVHLKFKDTPLKEAIAAFEKQAKTPINLIDPANKLTGKKITLDTGKVAFWVALDKFCAAAGLDEADPARVPAVPFRGAELPPPPLPPGAGPAPAPAIRKPVAEPKKKAVIREKKEAGKRDTPAPAAKTAVAFAVMLPPAIAVPPVGGGFPGGPPMLGGGPPMAGGPPPVLGGGPFMAGMNTYHYGKLNLIAGKKASTPTDTRTSVRVRVAPKAANRGAPVPAKAIAITLQAAPEPRLRWQRLASVSIDKAIDDNGQKLTKFVQSIPGGGGFGGAGGAGGVVIVMPGGGIAMPGFPGMGANTWSNDDVNHTFQLLLNKGEKASKKLKILSGTLNAVFLDKAKPFIVADNVMKAAGKTFKGSKGGSITISKVQTAKDGTIRIDFECDKPADVVSEQRKANGINPVGPAMPPIMIRPGVRLLPAPALPPVPAPAPAPGGAVMAVPAIAVWNGGMAFASDGLALHDAKGKVLPAEIRIRAERMGRGIGAGSIFSWQAVYKPRKGQPAEPAKLVFTGRASIEIAVPFKLENIDLK